MLAIHDLPESYVRKLEGMTTLEIVVAAATYRSSCRRKGASTQLILNWHRAHRTAEEHASFLLLYAQAWCIVKAQRQLGLAERPKERPVVGRRFSHYEIGQRELAVH